MQGNTYFISDIHLGAGYISDPRRHELTVVAFLNSIRGKARRLVLLGDVLDYWWEYKRVVPRGYTRFFGALAALADSGVEILWFKGNHDIWIFDYLPGEIGFKLCDGAMVTEWDGHRFFLEHGDGVGRLPRSFRMLRKVFRNTTAQKLYSLLPSRLTIWFAHRWSSHSRMSGGQSEVSTDPGENTLVEFAAGYNAAHHEAPVDYFVFGHQHIMLDHRQADGSRVIVIGDWIEKCSYAVWDGAAMKLGIFDKNTINTGV